MTKGERHCFWRIRGNGFEGGGKAREYVEGVMSFQRKRGSNGEENRDSRIAVISVVSSVVMGSSGLGDGCGKESRLNLFESKGTSTGQESVVIGLSGAMGGELEEGVEGGRVSLKGGNRAWIEERG